MCKCVYVAQCVCVMAIIMAANGVVWPCVCVAANLNV